MSETGYHEGESDEAETWNTNARIKQLLNTLENEHGAFYVDEKTTPTIISHLKENPGDAIECLLQIQDRCWPNDPTAFAIDAGTLLEAAFKS